ncbi:MAG: DUF2971 domain-containing protein [Proteobacteria bacterium]|nr:MAG: DUF2971 domain-containing protein [Pseudomonadota bacterium]
MKIRTLQELKSQGVQYLSKWHLVNEPNKLNTILNNQLYAGYSSGFNDAFDSQVRLSDDVKKKLAIEIKELIDKKEFGCLMVSNVADSNYYINILNQHLELLHGINIACFSELDPISVSSNYMWGHYGGSGLGVALCYNIDDLIAYTKLDDFNSNGCGFYDVAYDAIGHAQNYHIIKQYIVKTLSAVLEKKQLPNPEMPIITFLSSKTKHWENEKEWRFISLRNYPTAKNVNQYIDPKINTLNLIQETKQKDNKLFSFIKPAKLVFGWHNHKNKDWQQFAYNELEKWANKNKIECIYLDDKLDYDNEKFNTRPERAIK